MIELSAAQVAVLREFVEYSDAAIDGKMQLNNFACEGAHFDYAHAAGHVAPGLTRDEWDVLCVLFAEGG